MLSKQLLMLHHICVLKSHRSESITLRKMPTFCYSFFFAYLKLRHAMNLLWHQPCTLLDKDFFHPRARVLARSINYFVACWSYSSYATLVFTTSQFHDYQVCLIAIQRYFTFSVYKFGTEILSFV